MAFFFNTFDARGRKMEQRVQSVQYRSDSPESRKSLAVTVCRPGDKIAEHPPYKGAAGPHSSNAAAQDFAAAIALVSSGTTSKRSPTTP